MAVLVLGRVVLEQCHDGHQPRKPELAEVRLGLQIQSDVALKM